MKSLLRLGQSLRPALSVVKQSTQSLCTLNPICAKIHLKYNEYFFLLIYRDYVREELQYDYEGPVYLDSLAFNRFVSAMTSESGENFHLNGPLLTELDNLKVYIYSFKHFPSNGIILETLTLLYLIFLIDNN